jgi:hypothetical protein
MEFDPDRSFLAEMEALFGTNRMRYMGALKSDLQGRPYISDWFQRSVADAGGRMVCVLNGDLILADDWLLRLAEAWGSLREQRPREHLIGLGRRYNGPARHHVNCSMEVNGNA